MQNTVMPTHRAARIGLWLLPAYGILLGLGTLTHQPPIEDFDAYARYITTDVFLIVPSGRALRCGPGCAGRGCRYCIPGTWSRSSTRRSGPSSDDDREHLLVRGIRQRGVVQPGIGRAHLAGVPGMPALNADTAYGPALGATALARPCCSSSRQSCSV